MITVTRFTAPWCTPCRMLAPMFKQMETDMPDTKFETIDVDDSNFQECEVDVENTIVVLEKYIEESEFDLDKNIAKKIIKDVYMEALSIE